MRLVVAIHAAISSPPPSVLSEMVLFTNCLEITLFSRLRSHTRSKMVLCPHHCLSLPRCATRGLFKQALRHGRVAMSGSVTIHASLFQCYILSITTRGICR